MLRTQSIGFRISLCRYREKLASILLPGKRLASLLVQMEGDLRSLQAILRIALLGALVLAAVLTLSAGLAYLRLQYELPNNVMG